MSGGLIALLDDVAALARASAASIDDIGAAAGRASAKAAGVVVDDTAVTPQYVQDVDPQRELPIIWRIAKGSLFNKLVIILPIALLLSQFAPWALTPILMLGGTYLCFEGAEKIWGAISGHDSHIESVVETHEGQNESKGDGEDGGKSPEDKMVSGAIRTDLILSAEIMVISLNEVASEAFFNRLLILIVVAIAITALVYGAVAALIRMDDVGLKLAGKDSAGAQKFGRLLVAAMPKILQVISVVGTVAMLWVGGHIILVGLDELGWHPLYEFVHHAEEAAAHAVPFLSGAVAWVVNTFFSAVLGLIWGAVVVLVITAIKAMTGRKEGQMSTRHPGSTATGRHEAVPADHDPRH
ncbi:DUF808 domain-containing protein [Kocuria sp. JC486]|uniref:DUF808 domain-containing protein n=1 Tax=Kocuria soli TaxID=2485125 RepID=A0A3N3ZVG2_9MICC|nr:MULTISPECIES: DUF808 domain-containing protein [Kocuria]NHU85577.1 DUF808 domain-containing protein [Kocuria sp. JC486]ROZ62328.1 DUF808 domain-containing protein [Kocuria soli]